MTVCADVGGRPETEEETYPLIPKPFFQSQSQTQFQAQYPRTRPECIELEFAIEFELYNFRLLTRNPGL